MRRCLIGSIAVGALVFALLPSLNASADSEGDDAIEPDGVEVEIAAPVGERVGGEAIAELVAVEKYGDVHYYAGPCRITTALPEGYPAPTVPGAIEIKTYPSVRRAEVKGGGSRDDGMRGLKTTMAFWPLFRHIQKRDIAMTAPVEMDYRDYDTEAGTAEGGWSMSFLYRTQDLGETGKAGRVMVYDTEPVTVLSIGVRGDSMGRGLREYIATLETWIEESDDWEIAGDPRSFGYNGPDAKREHRWGEVQLPIRPVEREQTAEAGEEAAS